jgi:hypothetical protein
LAFASFWTWRKIRISSREPATSPKKKASRKPPPAKSSSPFPARASSPPTLGRQGGYKLAKPPEKIRLAEVLRVLGGDGLELALFGRGRQKPIPLERSSPTFPFFSSLERKFWEELKDRTLADLL